jgi:hypothetical protein
MQQPDPDGCTKPKVEPSTWKQQPDPDGCIKFKLEAGGITPKVEPCEEDEEYSPPLPPPVSDDWEVTPLSGEHHFFTTVMSRSHVQKQFQLVRTSAEPIDKIISDLF